ncbi:MAG: DUF962 domain-containing protein [Planctomycetota bacterium]
MSQPQAPSVSRRFENFKDFYAFYLTEHACPRCRLMHFVGTAIVIALTTTAIITHWWLLLLLPVFGYGFAWAGHLIFERNRPATFNNPFYSLAGDFVMFFDILRGKVKITGPAKHAG